MFSPFALEQAEQTRSLRRKIAPGLYQKDLFILYGGKIHHFTQFSVHLRTWRAVVWEQSVLIP